MRYINVSVARSDPPYPCPLPFNMSFISRIVGFLLIALVAVHDVSGAHTGDMFYFAPGLGACGFHNTGSQYVASVSTEFFHSFPGATPDDNKNPICQHYVTISSNDTSVLAQIVDYCEQCELYSIGVPKAVFQLFANLSVGVVHNVKWVVE